MFKIAIIFQEIVGTLNFKIFNYHSNLWVSSVEDFLMISEILPAEKFICNIKSYVRHVEMKDINLQVLYEKNIQVASYALL